MRDSLYAAATGVDWVGGVTAGTETGVAEDVGTGGTGTPGHGVRGVPRTGGSDAPSPGDPAGGVGVRRAGIGGVGVRGTDAAGVAVRGTGVAGVWARGIAVTGVCLSGCVAERCRPGTNGGGDDGRVPKASPIGSDGVLRPPAACGVVPTGMTPPQVEQRARTPPCGTFAGSTR